MHCNNGLNNKLVESLVENKVAEETGDLKYLQDSMYDFVKTLKEIILGEYSPEFFNKYVDEALKLHGSNLDEFLKIPKMGLELRQALNSIDEAIDTSNQEFKNNLVLLLDNFQTALDNMEYEARDPYDTAVELGFTGTKQEWLKHLEGDSAYKIATLNGFKGTEKEWLLYIRADGFIQSIQQFATNDSETQVQIPDYGTINSLQGYINEMFENGGLPATPFTTKALMESSELVDGDFAQVIDDTDNNGLYVKTEGVWVKSGYDPVVQAKTYTDNEIDQIKGTLRKKQSVFDTHEDLLQAGLRHNDPALVVADSDSSRNGFYSHSGSVPYKIPFQPQDIAKAYTDSLFSSKLTTTTNLNDLLTGTYYIVTADMNTIFDNGTYIALGYPTNMVRGGGAIVEVTRGSGNGTLSFQKVTYTSQGEFFTRSGGVGGSFTTWAKASGGGSGTYETVALGLTNAEDGDTFWVYPTTENGIMALTLYKRLNATTSEVVYTQTNPLDEYLITQNTKWEIV